jgi:hypothetical protein
VLAIEAQKHPLGTADHHLLSQELVVHTAGVIGGVEVTREVLAKGSEGERRVLRAPASGGQQVIDGDPVDPGRQAGVAAEGAQARGDLDEDLLGCILGILRVPQHPLGDSANVVDDRSEELFERALIAAHGGGDQVRRDIYSGHEVSRCALSTVSSRSSSAACASKTSSGMSGVWCIENVYSVPSACGTTRVCAGASTSGAGSST